MNLNLNLVCPCGSLKPFSECCELFIKGTKSPDCPEALMRSRYSAYATDNMQYIHTSMRGPALENFKANPETREKVEWIKLDVLDTKIEGEMGTVLFSAQYKIKEQIFKMTERSLFKKMEERWFYVDSINEMVKNPKIGRNDPCPCKSGKKYKLCCLKAK